MTQRLLTHYVAGFLSLVVLLGSCQPKQDIPQPNEPVPANLLVTTKLDSIITLTEQVDFSTVSETGQGPTGTLIRWDGLGLPLGSFQANTYDQRSRLVGTLATSYGYHVIGKYYYQGNFLAQDFSGYRFDLAQPLTTVQPHSMTKYQYNKGGQLAMILMYERVTDTDTFKLAQATAYEYHSMGQLQLTRTTFPPKAIGPTAIVNYWENGDLIHEEVYYPATSSRPMPAVSKHTYSYNQQPNPYALMNNNQVSEHAMTGIKVYGTAGGSLVQQYEETKIDYDNQFDAQGRVLLQKSRSSISSNSDRWTDWSGPVKFTYAP
ncbi:hypothetical protein [Spirosoma jeollabukense]